MKKILQVVGCLENGGTEQFLMSIYRQIDKNRFQFDFYVLNPQYISETIYNEIVSMGGQVIYGMHFGLGHSQRGKKLLKKVIRQYGPYDAIHSHINLGNAYILPVAKREKIPCRISHCHAIESFSYKRILKKIYYKYLQKKLLKSATDFVSCSIEAGVSLYGEYRKNQILVIKNGINYTKFLQSNVKELLQQYPLLQNNDCVWGNITRFDDNKNQLFILDIFKDFLNFNNRAVLVLGGYDAGCRQQITNKAKDLGIDSKVLILGVQTNIEKWLNLFNVFVFPSKSEGFGIALLEAEAAGCKCFASTNVPKMTDIGLGMVEYIDLQTKSIEWAKKIFISLSSYQKPSIEAREQAIIKNGFSMNDTIKDIYRIYER